MQGIIGFERLKVNCLIGCNMSEKASKQTIYIDLKLKVDFSLCSASDSVEDTVSYVDISTLVINFAEAKHHHLLETLASGILDAIFATFSVFWAKITIKKPGAIQEADYAFVELEHTKEEE